MPKNWRSKYPNSREDADTLSPNTVIKWSVALRAAYERANRNAGRKCVRGVVPEEKLLSSNPWTKFTWIEGRAKKIRQFDPQELVSFLDHLETKWPEVSIGPLMAKIYVWSASRREEIAGLRWDSLRKMGDEFHFDIVGKWGIRKWFRVPELLIRDLEAIKTDSPNVFGAFPSQLRRFHESGSRPWTANHVNPEFEVYNVGRWFYERVLAWSKTLPGGKASTHVFRKTTLQYARRGEDVNRQVALDARVTEGVMMTNYVLESDEELRQRSNRTFQRIIASLPPEVARRFGFEEPANKTARRELRKAIADENWQLVVELAGELAKQSVGKQTAV